MSGIAIPGALRGGAGIDISPEGEISTAGGASVTPFRILPVAAASTLSPAFVDLLVVPGGVDVTRVGDVLLDFTASIEVTPPVGVAFEGALFQFLWDGAPLSQQAFFELDVQAGTSFDSFASVVRLRALVPGATVGNHTLSVQWSNAGDPACRLDAFENNGNLTIEGK